MRKKKVKHNALYIVMTIKHIVLPGGGAAGFTIIGVLDELYRQKVWEYEDLESIHAVSAGSFIAVLIALKFEMDTITNYVINRPWENEYKVSLTNIFDVFLKKGFFGTDMIVKFMKPFFDSIDMSLDITMKQFFEHTKIELFFYTVELNSFELVEISHLSFPDLPVLKAVHICRLVIQCYYLL